MLRKEGDSEKGRGRYEQVRGVRHGKQERVGLEVVCVSVVPPDEPVVVYYVAAYQRVQLHCVSIELTHILEWWTPQNNKTRAQSSAETQFGIKSLSGVFGCF